MIRAHKILGFVAILSLSFHVSAWGQANQYWTNTTVSGDFTDPANWLTGTVPGGDDNANFTNSTTLSVTWATSVTNANVFLTGSNFGIAPNLIFTQAIGSSTWLVTNSYNVAMNSLTGFVRHVSGSLIVTNGARTGTMVIGQIGNTNHGGYMLTGGTVVVDQLIATNARMSALTLSHGSFTILNGSSNFGFGNTVIGGTSNQQMNLSILGGYNAWTNAVRIGNSVGMKGIVLVSGASTLWTNIAAMQIGVSGSENRLIISNGAIVSAPGFTMGVNAASSSNLVLVSDPNTFFRAPGTTAIGSAGSYNQLIISNGAVVGGAAAGSVFYSIGGAATSISNLVLVTGAGSVLSNNATTYTLSVGGNGTDNQLIVQDGGGTIFGRTTLGGAATTNSRILITGVGSFVSNVYTSGAANLDFGGVNTQLIISNGGAFTSFGGSGGPMRIAEQVNSTVNVLVTGEGSLLKTKNTGLLIGSNAVILGTGNMLIEKGGTLEANTITNGFNGSGTISNQGGVFQFSIATNNIGNNTVGSIVLTNGTISYRGITNADISQNWTGVLTNILFQGENNSFMLNHATNTAVTATTYTFGTGLGATNYQRLTLVNGATAWRGDVLTIGAGGELLVSNTTATIQTLIFTNQGTVKVRNSTLTFLSNAVNNGGFQLQGSANTIFRTNVFMSSAGYFSAGGGDILRFDRDLTMGSQQDQAFNLLNTNSVVLFSNFSGGTHVLDLTGSYALDRGTGFSGVANTLSNFAFGKLMLSPLDFLMVTGSFSGATTNALYVGILDIGGIANTNNLIAGVNIYYDMTLSENSFLLGNTYDLPGDGMLIPYGVPEPGIIGLLISGMAMMFGYRSRKRS